MFICYVILYYISGDELLVIHGLHRNFATHTWIVWGYVLLMVITLGGLSCVRPACDIFLAGITQSIPVFYLQFCLYQTTYYFKTLSFSIFGLLFVGVIFNAPLIVLYPHLLEMFGAAITNVFLHATLLISWGGQGRVRILCCLVNSSSSSPSFFCLE